MTFARMAGKGRALSSKRIISYTSHRTSACVSQLFWAVPVGTSLFPSPQGPSAQTLGPYRHAPGSWADLAWRLQPEPPNTVSADVSKAEMQDCVHPLLATSNKDALWTSLGQSASHSVHLKIDMSHVHVETRVKLISSLTIQGTGYVFSLSGSGLLGI